MRSSAGKPVLGALGQAVFAIVAAASNCASAATLSAGMNQVC